MCRGRWLGGRNRVVSVLSICIHKRVEKCVFSVISKRFLGFFDQKVRHSCSILIRFFEVFLKVYPYKRSKNGSSEGVKTSVSGGAQRLCKDAKISTSNMYSKR